MIDKLKMAERLRLARERRFTTAREAAAWLGIPYPTYSGNENGTTTFGLAAAANYARRFNVSLDWLVLGRGRGPATDGNDPVAKLYALIDKFPSWPEMYQRQALTTLEWLERESRENIDTTPTS